ncbi:MAG: hypothetical protein A2Y25_01570 [Candidatus Melainabacteria bacterium GWF2_37_15]|nr:MAG: hypothetical protein A2Y25_01570 [Candidatus Melainabacteria bacterium GWF2_37_15]
MIKPRISVIIPIYNAENTLEKCLDSIVNQTLSGIEIILIDDGSMDKSFEIANKYAQQDSRIKLIRQANQGLSDARNKGIKIAQGEYISFVDSDDWVSEEMYEELVKQAEEHNKPNVIKIYNYKVTQAGTATVIAFTFPNTCNKKAVLTDNLKEIMKNCSYAVWSGLWKKDFLHKHNLFFAKNIHNGSDILFTWQAMILSREVLLVFKPFYYYNLSTPSSVTRSINNKFLDLIKVFNRQKDFIIEQNRYEELEHTYHTRAYSYFSFGFKRALMLRGVRFHRYCELKQFFDEMRELSKNWDLEKIDFENIFEKQKLLTIQENNFIKYLIKTWALDIKIKALWLYVIKN